MTGTAAPDRVLSRRDGPAGRRPRPGRALRARYRRRRAGVAAGLVAVLAAGVYVPMTLLAPLEPVAASVAAPEPIVVDAPDLAWPAYGAGAIGAVQLPEVLERYGAADALPLASITKVVTALTVLDAHPLALGDEGPVVTMSSADVRIYERLVARNAKSLRVAAGQQFSQRDLLELALVESAANYATSLAVWAFGSEQGFLDAAAAWLEREGLASVRIVEPTGIDPGNVASTADAVALGRLALADPVVAQIVASPTEVVTNLGTIDNTNILLGIGGVDGIKTGTLRATGANLLFSATMPVGSTSVTLVGVVIGAPDHDVLAADVRRLLGSAIANVAEVPLTADGAVMGEYASAWDDDADLVTSESASVLVWGDATIDAVVAADDVTTADAGDTVGTLTFTVAGSRVEVPLELSATIDDPGAWWRLTHPGLVVGAP